MDKRAFLIILDSFGIGGAADAAEFGDAGSDTLASVAKSDKFHVPNMARLGLFNIAGVTAGKRQAAPEGAFARLAEVSRGKDTTIGHWEIAGITSEKPMPLFPYGFPQAMIDEYEKRTGRPVLCNKPYSGTDVIRDYGAKQMETGGLIVYTSADSVFQVAANEAVVPLNELYRCCEIARELLAGPWAVGRVIARPFVGDSPENFKRTANRHDYSLPPPGQTILDVITSNCQDVIGVGKIYDIFAGRGVTERLPSKSNDEGMQITLELAEREFDGLAFVNLVDFDMVYGHRNDVDGYAAALSAFDEALGRLLTRLRPDDLVLITADHGCDPGYKGTDHTRENVPLLMAGPAVKPGTDLGTRRSFATVAATLAEYFGYEQRFGAESLWGEMAR